MVCKSIGQAAGRVLLLTMVIGVTIVVIYASPLIGRATSLSECQSDNCRYLPFIERAKPVAVAGLTWTSFRDGSFGAVGTVKNTTFSQPVYNVIVEVDFYYGQGLVPEPQIVTTTLPAVLPGQLNPFMAGVRGIGGVFDVKASIKSYSLTSATKIVSQTLAFTPKPGSTDLLGTVRNTTPFTVTDAIVVLWTPAANGCEGIVTYNFLGNLNPGQSKEFSPSVCGWGRPWIWPSGETLAAAQAVVVP